MDLTVESTAFKELFLTVTSVVILLPENATRDGLAAALALYLSLTQMQKTVTVAYSKPPIVGWSHLVGVNKLTQKLGNKNFVVSLDYTEGSIDKVSYNIEGNKFNLVIEPRVGAPLFNEKNVSYSYSGMNADLIITLDAQTRESLGKYYQDNKQLFEEKPVVVIDNKTANTQYGKINVVRPAASISEIVTQFIIDTQMPIDGDIASNLYDGIVVGTRTFSSSAVGADTFEAAAYLLRQGARKSTSPVRQQEEVPRRDFTSSTHPETPQAPPDWLKPKIYKGSQLL